MADSGTRRKLGLFEIFRNGSYIRSTRPSVSGARVLLVLGTGSRSLPRTRVYILIAVVPKQFVVSRSKGLKPGWQLHRSRNPQQLNPGVHPALLAKLSTLRSAFDSRWPAFPIRFTTGSPAVISSMSMEIPKDATTANRRVVSTGL